MYRAAGGDDQLSRIVQRFFKRTVAVENATEIITVTNSVSMKNIKSGNFVARHAEEK